MNVVSAVFSLAAICAVFLAFYAGMRVGRRCAGEIAKIPRLKFGKKSAKTLVCDEDTRKLLCGINNILQYGTKNADEVRR